MSLNKDLLPLLVCPECKGSLQPVSNETGLKCPHCKLIYPVKDGIPVMLVDQAISTETNPD